MIIQGHQNDHHTLQSCDDICTWADAHQITPASFSAAATSTYVSCGFPKLNTYVHSYRSLHSVKHTTINVLAVIGGYR
jgi:hypothetical protein